MTPEELTYYQLSIKELDVDPETELYEMSDEEFESHLATLHHLKASGLI